MTTPSRPRYDGKSSNGKPISQSIEERFAVLCNPAGQPRPAWFENKDLLPKKPPRARRDEEKK